MVIKSQSISVPRPRTIRQENTPFYSSGSVSQIHTHTHKSLAYTVGLEGDTQTNLDQASILQFLQVWGQGDADRRCQGFCHTTQVHWLPARTSTFRLQEEDLGPPYGKALAHVVCGVVNWHTLHSLQRHSIHRAFHSARTGGGRNWPSAFHWRTFTTVQHKIVTVW